MIVFVVLFLLLTFWCSLLPPFPTPFLNPPTVSLRMLQKVGAWSSNGNRGQGEARAGRDAAGKGGAERSSARWGVCGGQAREVERKAGSQGPWMLELKSLINPLPLGPRFDSMCHREPYSKGPGYECGKRSSEGGALAISFQPPSPQQCLWGDF